MSSAGTTAPLIASRPGGLAGRYATALYELADERRSLDEIVAQADGLARLIDQNAKLRAWLASPLRDIAQSRTAVLELMASQRLNPILRQFVGVVINNRRLPELRTILGGFAALVAARRGIVVADVASAHALTDLQRTQLRARLTEAGYGRVNIQERVDAALLGGLVVRVGPRLYDSSLKSRLARLHYAMKGAA